VQPQRPIRYTTNSLQITRFRHLLTVYNIYLFIIRIAGVVHNNNNINNNNDGMNLVCMATFYRNYVTVTYCSLIDLNMSFKLEAQVMQID